MIREMKLRTSCQADLWFTEPVVTVQIGSSDSDDPWGQFEPRPLVDDLLDIFEWRIQNLIPSTETSGMA